MLKKYKQKKRIQKEIQKELNLNYIVVKECSNEYMRIKKEPFLNSHKETLLDLHSKYVTRRSVLFSRAEKVKKINLWRK